jgi:hypothetical protein
MYSKRVEVFLFPFGPDRTANNVIAALFIEGYYVSIESTGQSRDTF